MAMVVNGTCRRTPSGLLDHEGKQSNQPLCYVGFVGARAPLRIDATSIDPGARSHRILKEASSSNRNSEFGHQP